MKLFASLLLAYYLVGLAWGNERKKGKVLPIFQVPHFVLRVFKKIFLCGLYFRWSPFRTTLVMGTVLAMEHATRLKNVVVAVGPVLAHVLRDILVQPGGLRLRK